MVGTGDKAHPPGAGTHSSSFDFFVGGNLQVQYSLPNAAKPRERELRSPVSGA